VWKMLSASLCLMDNYMHFTLRDTVSFLSVVYKFYYLLNYFTQVKQLPRTLRR